MLSAPAVRVATVPLRLVMMPLAMMLAAVWLLPATSSSAPALTSTGR